MNSRYFFTKELTFNNVSRLYLKKEPNIIKIISKSSQTKTTISSKPNEVLSEAK